MGIHITWTDTNTAEDGYNVYRSLTSMAGLDPSQLPTPLAELSADATEYKDGTAVDGETYFYLIATRSGSVIVPGTEVEVTAADTGGGGEDFTNAQIGDEIGGGIYAGTITYGDGREFHIVAAKQEGEVLPSDPRVRWKTSDTSTLGANDNDDGRANCDAIIAAGLSNHPAAEYCENYSADGFSDWYLPARYELALLPPLEDAGHPDFVTNASTHRWSSTEGGEVTSAWSARFTDGFETDVYSTKSSPNVKAVRPIRRIPV